MSETRKPVAPDLFDLAAKAVGDCFERIQEFKLAKKYIGSYTSWPEVSLFKNGMPHFHIGSISSGPTDYTQVFSRWSGEPLINPDEVPSIQAFLKYNPAPENLRDHFKTEDSSVNSIFRNQLWFFLTALIERYMHLHGEDEFSVDRLLPLYLPLEAGLFNEKLAVDIVVPISFLHFDFDDIQLDGNSGIMRMGHDFQVARALESVYDHGTNYIVLGAATHALILRDYELTNNHWIAIMSVGSNISAYPQEEIDAFFTALRTVTGYTTGYAQLILLNRGWTHKYKANIPPLEGTAVRRYPVEFESDWLREVPTVTVEEATEVGRVYGRLRGLINNNQLRIAGRRLNLCYLRQDEEDAILDATIGLESLLVAGDRNEITHKLALRMAALSTLAKDKKYNRVKVFQDIKDIYSFRSGVAHGDSKKANKKREIAINDKETVPTVKAATDYLRMALRILLEHPQFLDPGKIDEELLLADGVK